MTTKKNPIDLGFLLKPDVQFENRIVPTEEAAERFRMADDNHRHVDRARLLEIFWSKMPEGDRPAEYRKSSSK